MKPIIFIFIVSSLFSRYVIAQDFYPLKRKSYHLNVAVDKKTTYEEDLNESPYVLPDLTAQIYPGESIFIEIEQLNGVIKNVKAVAENKFPDKTITISFTQSAKKKAHELMMLKIVNPFKYVLRYNTKIYLMQHKKWINTNVLPVPAGLSAFETWPDIITSIALADWSFDIK